MLAVLHLPLWYLHLSTYLLTEVVLVFYAPFFHFACNYSYSFAEFIKVVV